MTDEFIFRDLKGKKIKPDNLCNFNKFFVLDRKDGGKLGVFSRKEFERKFR